MELTTTSTLALFETTKEERAIFVRNVINEVREGNVSVLKLHMQAKSTMQLMDELVSNPEYKKYLLESAEAHGKKFEMYNSEFHVKEAGTKWDYTVCNDSVLEELLRKQEEINKKVKDRQKLLQIMKTGMADPDTGEMIYPAIKTSTTIVSCTLK